ncbi:MAG: carboxypeptidase-like regulatory domain-containing protein [Chitinophagales bacterium]|nr:carboxypeptidase-like regulatory domain-containing protein [Chitinophagales bacterium]
MGKAQLRTDIQREITQFSGIIQDEISKAPVPFAIIYVDKEKRGTVSTINGFFSFAASKGDVVIVKSLGYKPLRMQIPLDALGDSYYKDIILERAIYSLDTVTVYPLPKPHQLRQAIANLDLPDNMVDLAQKAIEKSKLDELAKGTHYDGTENFNQYIQNQVQSYYHYGQPAPIHLLDAFSWAKFIQSIRKKKGNASDKDAQPFLPEY